MDSLSCLTASLIGSLDSFEQNTSETVSVEGVEEDEVGAVVVEIGAVVVTLLLVGVTTDDGLLKVCCQTICLG